MARKPLKITLDADKLHRTKVARPPSINFKINPEAEVALEIHKGTDKTIDRSLKKTFNDEFLAFLDSLGGA